MLELCTELHECEKVLLASLGGVKYLGEVNFSLEDIDRLAALIREKISQNEEAGINYLKGFPACMSFYLVGKGITNYQGGEFWPPVLAGIGATETRSQYALGAIFFKLLRSRDLVRVRIKGALSYVTPILLHGGIPISCYKEFHEKVVKYFLDKKLVEENQIRNEIAVIRDIEKQRAKLLEQKEDLLRTKNAIKREIENLERFNTIFRKREELREKTAGREAWVNFCGYNELLSAKEAERLAIVQKKENLLNEKAEYQKKINSFTADDQKLLDYGGQVEKLVKEYKLYQEAKKKILAFDELLKCEGLLSTLSDEPPGHRGPGSAMEAISELIRQTQVKRTEAELAKEELEKEILPALDSVESRRDQVTLEIAMLEQRLIELGKGDLAAGVRLFEEIKQVLKELREVEAKLEELRPGQVPGSLAEALKLEQKLGQEISDLKIYIDLKNKQTELAEITSDLNNWADLPDYQEFMAAKKTEMDEIESELSALRGREAGILAVIQSLSQDDRIVLGLAEKVEKLAQELFHYQEGQKKQLLLQAEADSHTRRLESLAAEVWPGGWKEDYSNIVLGLDIDEVDRELGRYSRFNLERDRAEESLANYKIKEVRPGLALWLGGVLATIGLVVILTTQSNLGYLALPAGLVALAAGYRRFKKDRERLAGQEKNLKMLQQVLLRATDSLEKSKARLTQKLEGLPVTLESFTASTGAWVSLVRELQSAYRERRRCQEELAGLRQGVMEWESALKEVAAALPAPLLKAPEQVVVELTERVRQAGLRAKEADAAREVLEKEILPAVCSAERRRAQLEREINEVEQKFMELGKGDLAAGVQLIQEKKQAQQDLKEVEAKLEGLSFGQAGDSLDEALRLEEELVQVINNLKIYIRLKNRQVELEKISAFPCTWDDLPDYRELIAVKKTELDSLQRELESLKERERHKLALAGSYSPGDQKILELAEKIDISELSTLKKLMDNWEENFREVATSLSVPLAGSLEETLSGLVRQLKQAEGRKAAALVAQEALVMGVHPALDEAEVRLAKVEREIAALEQRVRELGKGDLAEGKRLLEEFRQDLAQFKEIENELEQYATLLPRLPGTWQEAKALGEEKNSELSSTKRDLFLVQERMDKINSPFAYVDEPVQRFVIYGGEWVIKWLWAGTALYRRCLGEAIDLTPVTQSLPGRVVNGLEGVAKAAIEEEKKAGTSTLRLEKECTEKTKPPQTPENGAPVIRERFSRPEIVFDAGRGELKMAVGGHSFQIFDNESRPEIFLSVVSGEVTSAWSADINLKGYLTDGMVEIPQEYISVPHISREYLVTLTTGEKSRTWRVQAYKDVPCLIFSEKGKMIEPGRLAEQRARLLFPDSYKIFNENALISSCDVYFNGSRYRQALVNFLLEPVVSLVGEQGIVYEISPSKYGLPLQPFLSNEETVPGAWADGKRAIYTGAVPKLCVPFNEDKEVNEWVVRVIRKFTDEATERLINVQTIFPTTNGNEEKYYEINLESEKLFGSNPLGEYTIVLSQGELTEYQFEMVIFPDLMVFFEQKLYFPVGEKGAKAKLSIVIPEALRDVFLVRTKKHARLIGRDGDEYYVSTDLEHDHLEMEFLYHSEGRAGQTFVTVEIPKVCWRIKGAKTSNLEEWTHYTREVWHRACYGPDNPQLEVKLPGHLSDLAERFKVILDGTGHQVTAKTRGRFLNFDLAGLADSLRGGKDVYSLWLVLEDARGRQLALGKLLDLRCRWRVDRFKYEVEESPGQWLLKATWVDLGEEQNRVAQLWRLWEPWTQPLTFSIPDGSSRLDVRMNAAEVLPGPYLLNFGVDDQWGGEGLSDEFPCESENSEIIYICGARTHILVDECVWEDQRKLRIRGSLAGGTGCKKVILRLYGVNKGEFIVWTLETSTDENGNFNLFAEPPKTTRPHWMGIIAKEREPIYHFQVLPAPGKLCWPLAYGEDFAGKAGLKGRIYIDAKEEKLDEPYLSEELSQKALQAWSDGKEKYDITIRIKGQLKKAQLWKKRHANDAIIKLETSAIKCTSCGKVEPDQKAWDQKHYPRCKSFKFNFREIKASLYWEWDVAPVLATVRKYSFCENHTPILYNNLFRPLPDDVFRGLCSQDSGTDAEALISLLWERELELLRAGGQNK